MDFNELLFIPDATIAECGHLVVVGHVIHPEGEKQPAVEIVEQHAGYTGKRRFSLSSIVHVALNVTDDEIWQIGGREKDFRDINTPNSLR